MKQLFTVRLDGQRYALPLEHVERVVRMVEITPLPEPPSSVLGLINLQGRVLSVVDLRGCFHLPHREVDPEDVLVIVRSAGGMVALTADGVEGVREWPRQLTVPADDILPRPAHLDGVVKLEDGLVLICDLERLLARGEVAVSPGAPAGGEAPGGAASEGGGHGG